MVWLHQQRSNTLELTVDNHPLRDLLIQLGFAWAAASYSRNDYDVAAGVQDTHALVNALMGWSVVQTESTSLALPWVDTSQLLSIEQYPNTYDGALPICGALGDIRII